MRNDDSGFGDSFANSLGSTETIGYVPAGLAVRLQAVIVMDNPYHL